MQNINLIKNEVYSNVKRDFFCPGFYYKFATLEAFTAGCRTRFSAGGAAAIFSIISTFPIQHCMHF